MSKKLIGKLLRAIWEEKSFLPLNFVALDFLAKSCFQRTRQQILKLCLKGRYADNIV